MARAWSDRKGYILSLQQPVYAGFQQSAVVKICRPCAPRFSSEPPDPDSLNSAVQIKVVVNEAKSWTCVSRPSRPEPAEPSCLFVPQSHCR